MFLIGSRFLHSSPANMYKDPGNEHHENVLHCKETVGTVFHHLPHAAFEFLKPHTRKVQDKTEEQLNVHHDHEQQAALVVCIVVIAAGSHAGNAVQHGPHSKNKHSPTENIV